MCLAVPGKILSVNKNEAVIDYGSDKRNGRLISSEFKIGDYVIVQGGIVVQKVNKKEAIAALKTYNNMLSKN